MKINKKLLVFISILALPVVVQGAGTVPSSLTTVLDNINVTVVAIGYAMVIIGFVVAGIIYLTSAGSAEKISTAKRALIAAVIGAVLIAGSTGTKIITKAIGEILGAR